MRVKEESGMRVLQAECMEREEDRAIEKIALSRR